MSPELVVMAAGMGSRYGGLKQLEAFGPSGETVMDYSLFDARRAGVKRVVFVIRRDIETVFRERVGARYEAWLEVDYAFQELDLLPPGFQVPAGRSKPWGTAHAVLAAGQQVRAPFLVINADDFYGAEAFRTLSHWLDDSCQRREMDFAMVAFRLANTLSDHGSVARGVCRVDARGHLQGVVEHTGLEREGEGALQRSPGGECLRFTGQEPVSMNFWGFTPSLFSELSCRFRAFLEAHGQDPKAEFFLPAVVDELLTEGKASVQVIPTPDRWFGVTYQADRQEVSARILALVEQGVYPADLWRRP